MRTNDSNVTATDNVIDLDRLSHVTGGVKMGPNGEGCTGPFGPCFPRPRPPISPTFPKPQFPFGVTDPVQR